MIFFFIGLPGAGKTTIGKAFHDTFKKKHSNTIFLDGDIIRELFSNDLDYSLENRKVNLSRILSLCHFLDKQEMNVVCSVLSVFPEYLEEFRKNFTLSKVIYINVNMNEIIARDQKGLFSNPEAFNVIGKDIPFIPPLSIDLEIYNSQPFRDLPEIIDEIMALK